MRTHHDVIGNFLAPLAPSLQKPKERKKKKKKKELKMRRARGNSLLISPFYPFFPLLGICICIFDFFLPFCMPPSYNRRL